MGTLHIILATFLKEIIQIVQYKIIHKIRALFLLKENPKAIKIKGNKHFIYNYNCICNEINIILLK